MFLCAADQSVRYIIPYGGSAFFIIQEVPMYQVLYRKYRPRVFADVYGQDHVTSTLKNEIKEGRISHAYLFTGSRGTGKTTCAKILAKAVNCPNAVDGEPCNACEICKGLDSGTIYDVVEIDAASNNGVDNIRDLREEVNYTPTRGKYRVYIIDEVHMLSTGAFNALLKTLEEPPAHVIFILATTEVHKLPATILSRCQRFDFKRIQPETMAVRLQQVAGLEGMELAPDAATLIARIADGALRDGLSILDQCAGRSKQITAQLVSEVAGLAGREALYRLSDAVLARDSSAAVGELAQLHENSYDMERLCVEMINHFRNFMMVKTVKKSRELIICTDDEYKHIEESAGQFTLAQILRGLDLFQSTLVKIKGGATPRIEMEMAFVRLCEPKLEADSDSINQRLSALERAMQNGVPAAPVKTVQSPLRRRALHRHNRLRHPPRSPRPQRQHLRRSRSLYLRLLRNLYLHLFRSLRLYSLNRLSLWNRQPRHLPRPRSGQRAETVYAVGGFDGNSTPHRHCPVWRAQWLPGLHPGRVFPDRQSQSHHQGVHQDLHPRQGHSRGSPRAHRPQLQAGFV